MPRNAVEIVAGILVVIHCKCDLSADSFLP